MVTRSDRTTLPINQQEVIGIIEGFDQLDGYTWDAVARKTKYNERSLRRVTKIYEAYWEHKDKLIALANGQPTRPKTQSDTVEYAKRIANGKDAIIAQRDHTINLYRQAFVQLIENGLREGIDVERLWTISIEKVLKVTP